MTHEQPADESSPPPQEPDASTQAPALSRALHVLRVPAARHGWMAVVSWPALLVMLVVATWQRVVFVLRIHPPGNFVWSDMNGYVDRAMRLADQAVTLNRFDTFYPPGTHVLMAPLFALTATKEQGLAANGVLWCVLSILTLWAVALMALQLFKHPLAALAALVALLSHWSFTAYTGFFMSENPFSCFMALALLMGLVAHDLVEEHPRRATAIYVVAGTLAGVATCIRPQFILGAMLLGLPLLQRRWPFVRPVPAAALALSFLLPCSAAMVLNHQAARTWVGMSGNGGFNFYQGHCDVLHVETHHPDWSLYYTFTVPVRLQRAVKEGWGDKRTVINNHMAWENGFFYSEGFTCIQADGWAHLERIYTNLADLFARAEPWPPNSGRFARQSAQANTIFSYALLLLIPLAMVLARRRRAERWLLLQMATLLPVALIFYGDCRYRVPYDMFTCLMAGGLLTALLRCRKDPRLGIAEGPTG